MGPGVPGGALGPPPHPGRGDFIALHGSLLTLPLHEPGCAPRASARAVVVREVHAGLQNKEKEAASGCALGRFTLFLGTKAPHFPNPSSPRGLGSSLGRGLWVLSISYDKSKASNLMLLICRLIRLRVCQRPQRRAGAGHGT